MRKILYVLIVAFGLISCEKYLEVEPNNRVVVKTYDDVKSMLSTVLAEYTVTGYSNNKVKPDYRDKTRYLVFNYYAGLVDDSTYLDNYYGARNNAGLFYASLDWKYEFIHEGLWSDLYTNIGFYNTIIDELNGLEIAPSQEEKEIILGEAKFLRARDIFKLLQHFSPYKDNKLGIPLNLNSREVLTYDKRRRTQLEIYTIIIEELKEILKYTAKPTDYNIFYDKQMAHALLAQVYLFKGASGAAEEEDYTNAITHASAALENESMLSVDNLGDMFKMEEDERGVFKDRQYALFVYVPFEYPNYTLRDLTGPTASRWNPSRAQKASKWLTSLVKPDDARTLWIDPADGGIAKFWPHEDMNGTPIYCLFRIAELKLIKAEAYARNNNLAEARVELEDFQRNRINGYINFTGTNDEILDEILNERKLEFCYERDMVWLDLKRIGKGFQRPAMDQDEEEYKLYTIEDDDYRFTLPIPSVAELENNNIEQNPGWKI